MTATVNGSATEHQRPLGGSVADRLGRLPEIVDELRRGDVARRAGCGTAGGCRPVVPKSSWSSSGRTS
ncbi:hypothetical protein, partial [Mycolicibacterium porcinum]|uniref:hypothetical protein n=1 Tax=Mycolicibacterium porcinum TaxID=39693 RepID=UPI00197C8EB6